MDYLWVHKRRAAGESIEEFGDPEWVTHTYVLGDDWLCRNVTTNLEGVWTPVLGRAGTIHDGVFWYCQEMKRMQEELLILRKAIVGRTWPAVRWTNTWPERTFSCVYPMRLDERGNAVSPMAFTGRTWEVIVRKDGTLSIVNVADGRALVGADFEKTGTRYFERGSGASIDLGAELPGDPQEDPFIAGALPSRIEACSIQLEDTLREDLETWSAAAADANERDAWLSLRT